MAFARGKYALGICDRCGFSCKYLEMSKEWTGLKVCQECYEPKHPQLTPPRHISDPEALQDPRPEVSLPQSQLGVVQTFGTNNVSAQGTSIGKHTTDINDPIGVAFGSTSGEPLNMTGTTGTVTVTTT
tara:strand:- start:1030 stop:1413 length:384 start_codon:yes stop_codon:yes gene_type:complete